MGTQVVMRKFLEDNVNSFVAVKSSTLGQWSEVTLTLSDGVGSIIFESILYPNRDVSKEYNAAIEILETIRVATIAAMDELVEHYTRISLDDEEEDEDSFDDPYIPADHYNEDPPWEDR